MNEHVTTLMRTIQALESEIEVEVAKRRAELRFGLERGKIAFEEEVRRRHKELKVALGVYVLNARPLVALTAPLIYGLIVPIALLDLSVMLFQAICFRAYDRAGPAARLPRLRSSPFVLSQRIGETELRLLLVRQRRDRVCQRSRGADGAALVPDQTCSTRRRSARAVSRISGFRRRGRLSRLAGQGCRGPRQQVSTHRG